MKDIYDVLVVGGGPAGMSSALYTSRNQLKTLIVDKYDFGGQLLNTDSITNYLGSGTTDSWELAFEMKNQIKEYGVEIIENLEIEKYEKDSSDDTWNIFASDGQAFKTKTLILATGTQHNVLPQLQHIENYLAYCAVCDAEFQKDLDVAVVGAGDTAYESALMIAEYAKSVTIYIRSKPKAKAYLQSLVNAKDNIHLKYAEIESGDFQDGKFMIEVGDVVNIYDNIFICIGSTPHYLKQHAIPMYNNYALLHNFEHGEKSLKVDDNLFMAGDMIHPQYRQVAIAVSDGAVAGLQATESVMKWNAKYMQ